MSYVFSASDGETIEVDLPMTDAPEFGAVILRDDKTYVRQIPKRTSRPRVKRDCHIVSHSQPRWCPDHKGEFTKEGKPVYTSWGEVTHYTDKTSDSDNIAVEYEGRYK